MAPGYITKKARCWFLYFSWKAEISCAISCCYLFSHQSLNRLKDLVAEHLDHLHYLNDILCLQIDNLNRVLTEHLVNRLFIPLYIYSLVKKFNTNSIEVIFILNRNVLPNLNFQAYCVQFHRLIFAKTLS